ncbi:hypothetical protein ACA910_008378 [Epithemia clementina (nom. ined.)]
MCQDHGKVKGKKQWKNCHYNAVYSSSSDGSRMAKRHRIPSTAPKITDNKKMDHFSSTTNAIIKPDLFRIFSLGMEDHKSTVTRRMFPDTVP